MLRIKNINVMKQTGDLVCDDFDCKRIGTNLSDTLVYGQGVEYFEHIMSERSNLVHLPVRKYVRNDLNYVRVHVGGALYKQPYSLTNAGLLVFSSPIKKKAKVHVQFFHDQDKTKGICVWSWMLIDGKDVESVTCHKGLKTLKLDGWSPGGEKPKVDVWLKRVQSFFPVILESVGKRDITLQVRHEDLHLVCNCEILAGDVLIITKARPQVTVYPPTNQWRDLWLAKKY